jgi:arylsulfatase A
MYFKKHLILLLIPFIYACNQGKLTTETRPNIIIIYVDDLGYGDLSCYGAEAVKTKYIDELADNGIKFTDAHCSASTCTPSRYALLTGTYAFRNNAAILPGDAPLIIDPKQETIASMLKKVGYKTGVIGKWHLGLGDGKPNWNREIKPGPFEIGFDYSFLIPATQDRVPTVFVENQNVVNLNFSDPISVDYKSRIGDDPTGLENEELLKLKADSQHSGTIVNGISRIGYMQGGHKAYWKDEDFSSILNNKATQFITSNKGNPFFLYYALPNIHVPRTPNKRFVGTTKMGPRGDAIAEMDWMVGEITKTLRKLGIEKNTLVIFSSDNGPILDDGYLDNAQTKIGNHQPSGIYKGGKYSAYEGGTRVPTIAYWPSIIQPKTSNALFSQVDIFASLANLINYQYNNKSIAIDSKNMMDILKGESEEGRNDMVEEAFTMALRTKEWKYIAPITKSTPDWLKNKNVATGLQTEAQLYNLNLDPRESEDLSSKYPERLKTMANKLKLILDKKSHQNQL